VQRVLTSKGSYTCEAVARVWNNITDYVTADEAADAVALAVREVREVVGGQRDQVVYGWSGGKDSIALQVVMERAGINRSVLGLIPHLEFRQYLDWVDRHRPDGLRIFGNTDLTPAWLGRPGSAKYLFPRTSKDGYFWTLAGTRRAQLIYQEVRKPVLQIYGRRTQDGNYIGQEQYGIQRTRALTTYCPLRAWPHELVLAVIHYYGRALPPVYGWPHGWTAGTGSWPGRRVGTYDESWAETWAIEPDRVREAAGHVPAAAAWLATQT
jgi:hypothetical protein